MEENSEIVIRAEEKQLLNAEQAWHYQIIPKSFTADEIVIYINENYVSKDLLAELEIVLGKKISIILKSEVVIRHALTRYYRDYESDKNTLIYKEGRELDFVVNLIKEADSIGSSDIHVERYEEKCRVRFRIDGKLIEKYVIPKEDYPALVNKLKIRANLDIAEKRLPQDGRISFSQFDSQFDIRVSILPTIFGEKLVLRLLSRDATDIDINNLGLGKDQLKYFLEGVKKSFGIVLISGPTGSGKTTTLYATLKELNNESSNIMTVEDPVEYTLEGINQVQLKESIGLTFSAALKSFLRQDPDIIMLGEIRDGETAKMAIRAALTGHLVLSTIHTNSAWGTISRLIDMGVPPYLLASTINITAAQRLVRLLCDNCKTSISINEITFPMGFKIPYSSERIMAANGCEKCHFSGYNGREALYEVIPIDEFLKEGIKNQQSNIDEHLKEKKIEKLQEKAFDLFANGKTSIEEVYYLLV